MNVAETRVVLTVNLIIKLFDEKEMCLWLISFSGVLRVIQLVSTLGWRERW